MERFNLRPVAVFESIQHIGNFTCLFNKFDSEATWFNLETEKKVIGYVIVIVGVLLDVYL